MCAALQKKLLAGLDSTQTEGVNALASLEDTINQLQQHGKLSYMKRIRLLVGFSFL